MSKKKKPGVSTSTGGTTSTGLPAATGAIHDDRFSIDAHLINLTQRSPFYADVVRSLTKVETTEIPTAGVVQSGINLFLYWNREWMSTLTPDHVDGVLRHECLHLILFHTTSRRKDPHWVWNWATDLAINCMIPRKNLPDGMLIPGEALRPMSAEDAKRAGPEIVARHARLSALIVGLPRDESSEFYFSKLMEHPDIKELEAERALNEAAMEEALRRMGVGGDGAGNHSKWGEGDGRELSEEDRQLLEGKVREILRRAQEHADKSNSWGDVPASMQAWIRKMVSGEIPWQAVLRQFVGNTHRADRQLTWTRSGRKNPKATPGVTYDYRPAIAVYVDQSGSVDDRTLELFFGELSSLSRRAEFQVFYFDTSVDVENSFTWKKGLSVNPQRTRCGGTDFTAPTAHALASNNIDGYIILTDGCAPKPPSSKKRRGWVLGIGNRLEFPADSGDVVITLKGS